MSEHYFYTETWEKVMETIETLRKTSSYLERLADWIEAREKKRDEKEPMTETSRTLLNLRDRIEKAKTEGIVGTQLVPFLSELVAYLEMKDKD